MTHFDKNPKNLYKNLEAKIPSIKIKNKKFMDRIHELDMPADFWWALSGEFAILAERVIIQSDDEPRFLNDLKNIQSIKLESSKEKVVSTAIINSIGREFILNEDFVLNEGTKIKKNINELLIDVLKDNSSKKIKFDSNMSQQAPLRHLTNFLNQLRLEKFKYLYLKIKFRLQKIYQNRNIEHEGNPIFYSNDSEKNFNSVLQLLLPENHERYFPKWFVWLSDFLVTFNHKWATTFGQSNIYQKILIAKSYEKFGPKNINVIQHGLFIAVTSWHLYRLSLFPNMNLKTINDSLYMPKRHKSNLSDDILFCPIQLPFVFGDFFSLENFWDFMKVYRSTIKILINALKEKKKIKIRYKNFKYMSGFAGPLTSEECIIPVENKRFEDVYEKYKLIVSMPFGTIAGKCYKNNLDYISYHYPFSLTDKESYLKIKEFRGVFTEGKNFLDSLEMKIKKF